MINQVPMTARMVTSSAKITGEPGWCGSVDWVLACEPKCHWLDSQSGHVPGLQAGSPAGGM